MELITHYNNAGDWSSVLMMEKEGKAFVRLYWYHDDRDSIYLDYLSVNEDEREQGIGRFLLRYCEEIAIQNNNKNLFLSVEKDSWMQDWYKREGFENFKKDKDKRLVWMKKYL